MTNTVFKNLNKNHQKRITVTEYLKTNFEVEDETINYFLLFVGKSLKETHEIYKKNPTLLKFNTTKSIIYENNYDVQSDYSSDEECERLKPIFNFPDIGFENQMRQEYKDFLNILQEDQQDFLFNNTKIDDFYRLFAPFYNPIF
jgi:hypothetical protein